MIVMEEIRLPGPRADSAPGPQALRTMELFGDRWNLLIVSEVLVGHRRFGEIQRRLGLARNVLSSRLSLLVEQGVLERRRYRTDPDWYEYHVTDRGRALEPVIRALERWDRTYMREQRPASPPRPRVRRERRRAR